MTVRVNQRERIALLQAAKDFPGITKEQWNNPNHPVASHKEAYLAIAEKIVEEFLPTCPVDPNIATQPTLLEQLQTRKAHDSSNKLVE